MTLDCTCNRLIEAERKAALWDGIVLCRDCRWRKFVMTRGVYECSRVFGLLAPACGFCAWGERNEGDAKEPRPYYEVDLRRAVSDMMERYERHDRRANDAD